MEFDMGETVSALMTDSVRHDADHRVMSPDGSFVLSLSETETKKADVENSLFPENSPRRLTDELACRV